MSADWPEVRLEDITSLLGDGLHGTPKYDENGEYHFINGNNLSNGEIVFNEKTKRSTEKEYLKYKKNLNDRTILVSINGTLGNVALYNGEKVFLGKSACYFNVNEDVDKQFVRYVVSGYLFQNYIHSLATGSTIKNVSLKLMRDFTFRLPPLEVQEETSKMLENLDNKIKLNCQTNQTLEQIAQAIFKSWFVDFEPTRAKIQARASITAGKLPGSDEPLPPNFTQADEEQLVEHAAMATISGKSLKEMEQLSQEQKLKLKTTAALFPEKLVDSELGEIPKGWEIKSLDEIAHYQNGLALQKFRPENESDFLPVLKISQLKKGFADGEEKASPNIKPECIVYDGDVVFSWSGSLVVDVWCGGKVALNQHLFKVSSEEHPKWFYYYWTKHYLEVFQQIAADKAVTMGHIKRSHLSEANCTVPSFDLSRIDLISDLLEKQIQLRLESTELQVLRDTLLPKLLSGELKTGGTH